MSNLVTQSTSSHLKKVEEQTNAAIQRCKNQELEWQRNFDNIRAKSLQQLKVKR